MDFPMWRDSIKSLLALAGCFKCIKQLSKKQFVFMVEDIFNFAARDG